MCLQAADLLGLSAHVTGLNLVYLLGYLVPCSVYAMHVLFHIYAPGCHECSGIQCYLNMLKVKGAPQADCSPGSAETGSQVP